jgi:hypothetical protein
MALIQGTNGNDLNIRGSESTIEGDYIKAGNGRDYVFANAGDDLEPVPKRVEWPRPL